MVKYQKRLGQTVMIATQPYSLSQSFYIFLKRSTRSEIGG